MGPTHTSWLALASAINLLLLPSPTQAHAARTSLTTTTFLWVSPIERRLDGVFSVAFGDVPAHTIRGQMDRDNDGIIDASEEGAFFDEKLREISVCLLFREADSTLRPELNRRGDHLEEQRVVPVWLRIEFDFTVEIQGEGAVSISDRCTFPARGDAEVRLEPALGTEIDEVLPPTEAEDGVVSYQFSGEIPTISFLVRSTEAEVQRFVTPASRPEPPPNELSRLLQENTALSWWALLVAFLLGALHALAPGHGKTLVAAYLVGERGSLWQAVLLGLVVTLSHVSSVILLGLVALWASESLVPAALSQIMSVVSGALIALLGVGLLRKRWLSRQADQLHGHSHDHDHIDEHEHIHDSGEHHHHGHLHGSEPQGLWGVLVLGVSGGMVPCPSALVVLLLAISLGRIVEGMLLIVAFSVGLASILIVLGALVVHARRFLDRISPRREVVGLLPLISAAVVTVIGCVVTVQALFWGY